MEKLYQMVSGYFKRFPNGVEPYQMVTRLLEECGEVATHVNHFENSGVKRQKYGEPNKNEFASEIKQALVALMQLVVYYNLQNELSQSIEDSLQRMRNEHLI